MSNTVHNYDAIAAPEEFNFQLNKRTYVMRRASADAGRRWRNANTSGATLDKDTSKFTLSPSMADSSSILVQGCVFEQFGTPTKERSVSIADVRNWPDIVVEDLFKRAKEMSGLDKTEDEVKNLPPDSETTSS